MKNHPAYMKDYLEGVDEFKENEFLENYLSEVAKIFMCTPCSRHNVLDLPNNKICKKELYHGFISGICLASVHDDNGEIETFIFSDDEVNKDLLNSSIKNPTELINYCYYFKEKAGSIIQKGMKQNLKLIYPTQNQVIIDSKQKEKPKFETQKYYLEALPDNKYLTKKEFSCLILHVAGYSAKEIALKLELSHQTIETHLKNIRSKAKTKNLCDLVASNSLASMLLNKI